MTTATTATEDKIFSKLDAMSEQLTEFATRQTLTAEMLAQVCIDVKGITMHGCALAATHSDHETRMRAVEKNMTIGTTIVAITGTFIGSVIAWVVDIIRAKHG